MDFWAWEYSGDTAASVDYAIGTTFFDSSLGSGTSTGLSDTNVGGNYYGYAIDEISFSFASPISLAAGTYYVTLQNGSVPNGDPIYWDENGGPSSAQTSSYGTEPSEAFNITGASTGTPEPGAMPWSDAACSCLAAVFAANSANPNRKGPLPPRWAVRNRAF